MATEERGDFMGLAAGTQIEPTNQFTVMVVLAMGATVPPETTD